MSDDAVMARADHVFGVALWIGAVAYETGLVLIRLQMISLFTGHSHGRG